jgi:cytochrome c-type biogenesis protein CcmH
MLGGAYSSRHEYYRAADAYERADRLANGNNVEALLGFGEALVLADQSALSGRAGDLLERALNLEPHNPRALWWGGATAYQRNNLAAARTRWQQFLASNPPPDVAQVVTVKISEIDQRLGPALPSVSAQAPATGSSRPASARARVRIDLAPELKAEATSGALFVLARHAGERGPPLAVKRLALGAWPVDVELSEQDSMMPGQVLTPGDEVQIIARISRAGTAAPASGDSYGEVRYRVGRDGLVTLRIDKQVQ